MNVREQGPPIDGDPAVQVESRITVHLSLSDHWLIVMGLQGLLDDRGDMRQQRLTLAHRLLKARAEQFNGRAHQAGDCLARFYELHPQYKGK